MQERKERKITLKQVFDEYPSCFFLVEPIIKDGKSEDVRRTQPVRTYRSYF